MVTAMGAHEGYVQFRGHRTWYRFVGDLHSPVTPLLALHGGPGSTHNYFAPLEALASERPVVLYDQIGCGIEVGKPPMLHGSEKFGPGINPEVARRSLQSGSFVAVADNPQSRPRPRLARQQG